MTKKGSAKVRDRVKVLVVQTITNLTPKIPINKRSETIQETKETNERKDRRKKKHSLCPSLIIHHQAVG